MKKKSKIENELRNLYHAEAEHFCMPDENDIDVIRNAKAAKHVPMKKTIKSFQNGSLIASAAVIALMIMAIPFLYSRSNVVPIITETGNTTQPSEGEICKNTEDASASYDSQSNIDSSILPSDETKKADILIPPHDSRSITEDPHNNYPDLTMMSLSQWLASEDVKWLDGSLSKGNKSSGQLIELGKVVLDEKLVNLFDGNPKTVYAVMVDFSSMINDEFIFEGKKISELSAEKDALIAIEKMEEAKLVSQKIKQAKEAFYFSMLDTFDEKFTSMGLGIYHENRGCTIDNCIFYTFATQAQLENFECTSSQAFIFSAAVRFK